FIPGPNGGFKDKTIKPISIEEHKYRHSHLVLPLAHMMGACVWEPGYRMTDTPGENIFPPEYKTDKPFAAHTLGVAFKWIPDQIGECRPWPSPSARAVEMVKRDFPIRPFVITLRECYTPERNSNLETWKLLADYARDKGESVVIVRDTDKPLERFCSHKIAPLASLDVDYRLALYKHAKMNFGVNNGTSVLNIYSDMPYRIFKMVTEGYRPTSAKYLESVGLPVGSQIPWAVKGQKIIWEDDNFPALQREFDDWRKNAPHQGRYDAGRGVVENGKTERSRASA
ncbi:hypothetical protein LCGC14_2704440, partial [marine sediment metagenome]